jgi:hypothetical protein
MHQALHFINRQDNKMSLRVKNGQTRNVARARRRHHSPQAKCNCEIIPVFDLLLNRRCLIVVNGSQLKLIAKWLAIGQGILTQKSLRPVQNSPQVQQIPHEIKREPPHRSLSVCVDAPDFQDGGASLSWQANRQWLHGFDK